MFKPKVDKRKCRGCKSCINICPIGVYDVINKKAFTDTKWRKYCIGCENCLHVCKFNAIKI